ncbi:hypothetical protein EDB86DRAFT_1719064 [Lactarius hatsudake]|nr:hypothetical protein EDB86DRAFT_1719064 [Lactarius hatsudake]
MAVWLHPISDILEGCLWDVVNGKLVVTHVIAPHPWQTSSTVQKPVTTGLKTSFERITSNWRVVGRILQSEPTPTETTDRTFATDDDSYKLPHCLDLAQNPEVGQEAAVDNFAAKLLETLGLRGMRQVIVTSQVLPLVTLLWDARLRRICGEKYYLLLVPQTAACRCLSHGITSFAIGYSMSQPSMRSLPRHHACGTSPTFYKIPGHS